MPTHPHQKKVVARRGPRGMDFSDADAVRARMLAKVHDAILELEEDRISIRRELEAQKDPLPDNPKPVRKAGITLHECYQTTVRLTEIALKALGGPNALERPAAPASEAQAPIDPAKSIFVPTNGGAHP